MKKVFLIDLFERAGWIYDSFRNDETLRFQKSVNPNDDNSEIMYIYFQKKSANSDLYAFTDILKE